MKIIKKKSLGQNFLKDENVLNKIVKAGELSSTDNVLEIGPGEGALTSKLLTQSGRVVVIEKDERMKSESSTLQKLCQNANLSSEYKLRVYFEDVLKVNLPKLLEENQFNHYKVIANIPYYITGKIIKLLFEQEQHPELIVLLVQKEVADRIEAKNGRQSILSLSVQYYADVEIIDYVPREAFDPAPKVDSAILKIVPFKNEKPAKKEEGNFFELVKIGFSSPRKILISNLKNGLKKERSVLEKIFQELNLNLNIRAEKLSVRQWQALGEKIK